MKTKLLILPILLLALVLRWYKIDNPVADWHSWRQADTASVSWQFLQKGIDLLHPTYQDLSNIPSGRENLQGYRMVEFPLYNAIHTIKARFLPLWSFDLVGRLTSVVYSLISIIFLYLIVSHLSGTKTALLSAFFLAVLPFSVYYSRAILPEPLMTALLLVGSFLFLKSRFLTAAIFLATALLVKPYAAFFFLPLFWLARKKKISFVYLVASFLPLLAWRLWIRQFPEGIPASAWLYNLDNIRLRPAWWRWLFGERLARLILGYFGLLPLLLGHIRRPRPSEDWFYHLWLVGVLAYLVVFAGGNVTHDYYQAIIIPVIAVFLAKGSLFLWRPPRPLLRPISLPVLFVSLVLMLGLSWYQIRGYYQINRPAIVVAGQKADQLLPRDAKVIAPYNGDTAFLYQTRRQGWPAITHDLDQLIQLGATHYVAVDYDATTAEVLGRPEFTVLERTPDFVIVQLRP